jgi:hypothetical protein
MATLLSRQRAGNRKALAKGLDHADSLVSQGGARHPCSRWLSWEASTLGRVWASELDRHFR